MFKITSRFNQQEYFRHKGHSGTDIAMPRGTELPAVESGTIHLADYGGVNSGKTIFINTEDGHKVIYGHLSQYKVTEGQHVEAGDIIALSGNSGHVVSSSGGDGAHLHLGLKDEQNNFINPEQYVHTDGSLAIHSTKAPEMPDPSQCNVYEKLDGADMFNNAMNSLNNAFSDMATNFIDLFLQYSADTVGFIINLVLPFLI